jgi:tRNA U34 5-methylaminomethyl-2-thiouridine-forming methyltransferase MnmC
MLSRNNLLKKIKEVKNDVKVCNLHVHAQITKLASYTIKANKEVNADIMAIYRSIPCRAFQAEICSMDKECREKNWDVKQVLAEAIVKYNGVCTTKEWVMDLKKAEPPPNPLALLAYQRNSQPQP